jgi:RNA polymerase sigma factor (TIGR02999 family)
MAAQPQVDFTDILLAWRAGDDDALPKLTAIVYDELHRLAQYYMARERPDHTLQATALVNEAYLRLVDSNRVRWQNRAHFMAVAAQLMRRILVDFARQRRVQKRGGGAHQVTLHEGLIVGGDPGSDLVALDDALNGLAKLDPRKSQVVEMRFFGGLSLTDTAEALGVSPDTVGRDWTAAKAWLLRELTRGTLGSDAAFGSR